LNLKTESQEQSEFVKWFKQTFPGVLLIAIPNGAQTGARGKQLLKQQGLVPGVPDLFVPAWHLWLEMKQQSGGKVSPQQTEVMAYRESVGYFCAVAKGAEEAKQICMSVASSNGVNLSAE
jgi:hypothetical protein